MADRYICGTCGKPSSDPLCCPTPAAEAARPETAERVDLIAIEELLWGATRGPWKWDEDAEELMSDDPAEPFVVAMLIDAEPADARLIALAPALASEVLRLSAVEAERAALEARLAAAMAQTEELQRHCGRLNAAWEKAEARLADALEAERLEAGEREARGVALERLKAGMRDAIIWHEAQDKALSKQPPSGDRGWRRSEHQEQAEALRAAGSAPAKEGE